MGQPRVSSVAPEDSLVFVRPCEGAARRREKRGSACEHATGLGHCTGFGTHGLAARARAAHAASNRNTCMATQQPVDEQEGRWTRLQRATTPTRAAAERRWPDRRPLSPTLDTRCRTGQDRSTAAANSSVRSVLTPPVLAAPLPRPSRRSRPLRPTYDRQLPIPTSEITATRSQHSTARGQAAESICSPRLTVRAILPRGWLDLTRLTLRLASTPTIAPSSLLIALWIDHTGLHDRPPCARQSCGSSPSRSTTSRRSSPSRSCTPTFIPSPAAETSPPRPSRSSSPCSANSRLSSATRSLPLPRSVPPSRP